MHINGILGEKGFAAIERADAFRSGQKQKVILVIAADRGVAKIYQWGGDRLKLVGEDVPDSGVQGEHANKGVRRVVSSGGGGTIHHKYEPHMDEGRQVSRVFAKDLAEWLHAGAQRDAYTTLWFFSVLRAFWGIYGPGLARRFLRGLAMSVELLAVWNATRLCWRFTEAARSALPRRRMISLRMALFCSRLRVQIVLQNRQAQAWIFFTDPDTDRRKGL